MPTNKELDREMEGIKKVLDSLTEKMDTITDQQAKLLELVEEVKGLKKMMQEKDERIVQLERRVDDLELYTRKEDVVISGLKTRHRSYASVTSREFQGDAAPLSELQTLEEQVIQFFHSKEIPIQKENIAACHTLPRKDRNSQTEPTIILRFANRRYKTDLLRQGKKLKGSNVYMNEHLTKKNADIAKYARLLRKQTKIQSTWTRDCRVWIRTNGSPEEAKAMVIRERRDLEKFE